MGSVNKSQIKIGYSIATKIGKYGLGTVSYYAIKALDELNYLDFVVSYGNDIKTLKAKKISLPGNPAKLLFFLPRHYYTPLRKGFLDYITSQVILKRGCDIFHGWNNQALRSIKAAKSIGAKTIIDCGSTFRSYKETILSEEYQKFRIKHKKISRHARSASLEEIELADFILVSSEFAKRTFVQYGVREEKLFVTNRGVNTERFSPPVLKKDGTFRVLFAGRISLRKGIPYLLEAWKGLKLKNSELILIGDVDDEIKPILSKYNNIENIYFKGFMNNPEEVFRESTIFVFPSIEEGSAKVTYEAMASGLPIITTENSGSVVRNGMDGYIIPIRDVKAIREKIVYFYENPSEVERMGKNAVENVKSYTWENYRKKLISAYEKILAF